MVGTRRRGARTSPKEFRLASRSPRQEEIDELAALAMAPLVEVAWADGRVTPAERAAVLEAARTLGLDQRSEFCRSTLKRWLYESPPEEEFLRWRKSLAPALTLGESRPSRKIARRLLAEAQKIAKMDARPFEAGASVDAGAGITVEEERVLDDLTVVLEGVHREG